MASNFVKTQIYILIYLFIYHSTNRTDPDENVQANINNSLVESPYDDTLYYYGTAKEISSIMKIAQSSMNITLGRGFGEYIDWVAYPRALELCRERNMPMMLIIHKTWCGACKALKPTIKNSRPIWELSKYFIMVNVEVRVCIIIFFFGAFSNQACL